LDGENTMVPGTPNAPPAPVVAEGLPGVNVVSVGGSGADLVHQTSPSAVTHQAGGTGGTSLVKSGGASAKANRRGGPAVRPAGRTADRHGTPINCRASAADFGAATGLCVAASTKH
jgi:hypothetical protein